MDKLRWIDLRTTDPTYNLAAEQYVFDELPRDSSYFMLWQNDNAVIIGKYQNTYAEIDSDYVSAHGIKVVRRLSGGGAVYHDMGNLNFTFITDAGDSEQLNMRLFCEPIVRTLAVLGIRAEINGRNDMTVEGKKFSGNSQYMRGGRIMHHGTLMVSSDLSVLMNALRVDSSKLESKGMKSVRSRVTNLSEHTENGIDLDDFRRLLIENIAEVGGGTEYRFSEEDLRGIEKLQAERYSQWDWNYGKSPSGIIRCSERVEGCGKLEIYIETEHGLISSAQFCGDFFSAREPSELAEILSGCRYSRESLGERLGTVEISDYFYGLTLSRFLDMIV